MGDHPYFRFPYDKGGGRKLGHRVSRNLRYKLKPYKVVFDVWVRKTRIHQCVLLMVGLRWY